MNQNDRTSLLVWGKRQIDHLLTLPLQGGFAVSIHAAAWTTFVVSAALDCAQTAGVMSLI